MKSIYNNFISNLKVSIYYLKSDLIKKQRDFKIGLLAVFLVVFFSTLLLNAIQYSSTIFVKLSEEQESEIDLILTPNINNKDVDTKKNIFESNFYNKKQITFSNTSNYMFSNLNFLNLYEIKEKLANLSFTEGISPRWFIFGKASNKNKVNDISNEFKTSILILDSSSENSIGIGRALNLPELEINECYISSTLVSALKVKPGDIIQMEISLSDILKTFFYSNIAEANKIGDFSGRRSNGYTIDPKRKYGNEILLDEYENEEYNDMDDETIKINLGFNTFDNNKYKEIRNNILKSPPVKKALSTILEDYIKKNIVNNVNKTLGALNYFLPKVMQLKDPKDLTKLHIKRIYLKDPLIKDIPFVKELDDVLFGNETKKDMNNKNSFQKIKRALIKKIFVYNNQTDLIYFDSETIEILSTGNASNYLEKNMFFEELFDKELLFDNITKYINIKLNLTVVGKIKSNGGKWPSKTGNVLAIDSKHLKDYLLLNSQNILNEIVNSFELESMRNAIWNSLNKYINNFDINKYCLTINIMLKHKYEIYKLDPLKMRYYFSEISEKIIRALKSNDNINVNNPLAAGVIGFSSLKIFLQDIFFGIMFFLWLLSIILVYSLMLGNVDERTYEFGMMRSLGFKKNNLIYLIILKGIIFAIPGTVLGLTSSYIVNNFIAFLFNWYSGLVMPFFMSNSNLLFGITIGLSIPLISSYLPIRKCLNNNLRDTLIIFNNKKIGDIVVSMIKLEKLGISPTVFISSITLIIIGFLTYYLCPLSYLLQDLSLFLFIMTTILIIMLLGLIILSQLLAPYIQNLILKIVMFFAYNDRKFHLIVLRNLDGHKRRNNQVSIMFMIALGFVIFAGCSLNLVVALIEQMSKHLIGGDFSVYVLNKNHPNLTLNEISLNSYFDNITKYYPDLIKNYSYYTFSLEEVLSAENFPISTSFGSLNGFPIRNRIIRGIDKNYIESSFDSLYFYSEYDKSLNVSYTEGKIDLIKMLYNNPNIPKILQENKNNYFIHPKNENEKEISDFQLNILMSHGIKRAFAVNLEDEGRLGIKPSSKHPNHFIPCKVVGLITKLPGIYDYSSYKQISYSSHIYISLEQFKQLIELESNLYNITMENLSNMTYDGLRKKRLLLKFKDNVSKELKDMVYFGMNNYIKDLNVYSIQLSEIIDTVTKIKNVIEYIFFILGIISLVLSFFLIWTSFYNNIKENIAEYGIMRSIGITKKQNIRIYLYEAFVIIITSVIIGTVIGVVISSSIILLFDIFFELTFIFNFPFKIYFILLIQSLFLGLLGSYYPTYNVNTISLVKIIKGFNE